MTRPLCVDQLANAFVNEADCAPGKEPERPPCDINPFSFHLETEYNNRLNVPGKGHANAVWQISIDWLINNRIKK